MRALVCAHYCHLAVTSALMRAVSKRAGLIAAVLTFCAIMCALAPAARAAPAVDEATRSAARDIGYAGVDAFQRGDYGAARERLEKAFARGSGHGLLWLGGGEVGEALPPAFAWWRDFAGRYIASVCLRASDDGLSSVLPPVGPPPRKWGSITA